MFLAQVSCLGRRRIHLMSGPSISTMTKRAALGDVLGDIPCSTASPRPPYDPRFDLDSGDRIGLADVLSYIPVFNLTLTP